MPRPYDGAGRSGVNRRNDRRSGADDAGHAFRFARPWFVGRLAIRPCGIARRYNVCCRINRIRRVFVNCRTNAVCVIDTRACAQGRGRGYT
jgi:hypothetical protein